MGEGDKENIKSFKDKMKDDHRKKYEKKKPEEMSEAEKQDEEEMRALNNGPTSNENRSCQDILCCLIFLAFLAGCVVVTGLGFSKGNPDLLVYVYDEDGHACGKSGEAAADYPLLYLYDAISQIKSLKTDFINQSICVKRCPTSYDNTTLECLPTTNNTDCSVSEDNIYLSESWLNTVCFPSYSLYQEQKNTNTTTSNSTSNKTEADVTNEYNSILSYFDNQFISGDKLFSYIGDLITTYPIMFACVGIALVLGFIYLFIIRLCGGVIAYLTIFFILAVLILLGYVFYNRMDHYEQINDDTYKNIMLAFAIVFWALAFIWLIIILCSCNKIRLAIAITEVAAIFVWKVMAILFVPVIMFVVSCLYIAYWIALSVYIYSAGDVSKSSSSFMFTVTW